MWGPNYFVDTTVQISILYRRLWRNGVCPPYLRLRCIMYDDVSKIAHMLLE